MIYRLVLFFITITCVQNVLGQTNIDSLFTVAVNHAKQKNYNDALSGANKIIELDSARYDVMVFMANVHAWKKEYSDAKNFLNIVYANDPENIELYDTWLNVLLWSEDYKTLLETTNIAEDNGYDNYYNLTLKRALAFQGMNQHNAGVNYLNQNSHWLDSTSINYVYFEMKRAANKNIISGFYSIDLFDNNDPSPQHLAYVDYSFTRKNNIIIVRLNYANRFNTEDLQPEVDLYRIFNNNHYLYANYGFGIQNKLFPRHRFGIEYFVPLDNNFEVSAGAKLFLYENTKATILTGHIGKYISSTWLSFRPYYTLNEGANSFASLFNMRIYGKNQISYWGLELGYGNSPDDRSIITQPVETIWLSAYKVKAERNFYIKKSNELRLGAGYAYEEIREDEYRNRFILELIFKHRF